MRSPAQKIPEIASITGHSLQSIVTIMKHYLSITREFSDSAIEKLEAWMLREGSMKPRRHHG